MPDDRPAFRIASGTTGDAAQAAFATAGAALAAALAAQRALLAEDWASGPLRVRMALHAGAAELRDGDYLAPGPQPAGPPARGRPRRPGPARPAAQRAGAGDALPAGAALRDLGEHRLRDLARPERVFQLSPPGSAGRLPAAAAR